MDNTVLALNTKEKILSAAFSVYYEKFSKASLSDIAKKTGISKTAIYRHFKNKESLEKDMFSIVYDSFYQVFKKYEEKMLEEKVSEAFSLIIEYIDKYTEYASFYMLMTSESYQDNLIIEMKNRGARSFDSLLNNDGSINKLDFYITTIFSMTCILFFVANRKKTKNNLIKDCDFYKSVSNFILYGLKNDSVSISSIRLAELEKETRASVSTLASPDRMIIALNSAIEKYGLQNVTVEQIASELNMTKSSLYTWFANKKEIFLKLVHKELDTLLYTVIENQSFAESRDERVFLLLSSGLEFLLVRPHLIKIFQWMQLSENLSQELCDENRFNMDQIMEDFFKKNSPFENIPDLGFGEKNSQTIINLIFVMPVFTLAHGMKHKLPVELNRAAIREIFFMIEKGIKTKINKNGGIK